MAPIDVSVLPTVNTKLITDGMNVNVGEREHVLEGGTQLAAAAEVSSPASYKERKMNMEETKNYELSEEELANVAGGGATKDRYDPKVCPTKKEPWSNCTGPMTLYWCDHYRKIYDEAKSSSTVKVHRIMCLKGSYSFEAVNKIG